MQIRAADPARDAPACAAIYAPFVTDGATSFEETPPDPAEFTRRIKTLQASHAYLVAEDEQGITGFAYGAPHRERAAYRWSTEVSVYVHERARRQGVGRALYGELLPGLAQRNYRMALAGIALPNEPSVRLHESIGFAPVGVYRAIGWKYGAWRDVGWWQRPLRDAADPDQPPQEPR